MSLADALADALCCALDVAHQRLPMQSLAMFKADIRAACAALEQRVAELEQRTHDAGVTPQGTPPASKGKSPDDAGACGEGASDGGRAGDESARRVEGPGSNPDPLAALVEEEFAVICVSNPVILAAGRAAARAAVGQATEALEFALAAEREKVGRLREALKPLAYEAIYEAADVYSDERLVYSHGKITVGDLRRAASLLAAREAEPGGQTFPPYRPSLNPEGS